MKSLTLAFLVTLVGLGCARQDHPRRVGNLVVSAPWSRETPPAASVAAGYVTIQNKGGADDVLLNIETTAAKRVEIHETRNENGVMRMRQRTNGVLIPAGQTVVFGPGGDHLMFIEPTTHLVAGERREASLVFRDAGKLQVSFEVHGMAALRDGAHPHH